MIGKQSKDSLEEVNREILQTFRTLPVCHQLPVGVVQHVSLEVFHQLALVFEF